MAVRGFQKLPESANISEGDTKFSVKLEQTVLTRYLMGTRVRIGFEEERKRPLIRFFLFLVTAVVPLVISTTVAVLGELLLADSWEPGAGVADERA